MQLKRPDELQALLARPRRAGELEPPLNYILEAGCGHVFSIAGAGVEGGSHFSRGVEGVVGEHPETAVVGGGVVVAF